MNAVSGNNRNKYEEENLKSIFDQAPVGLLTFDSEFKVNSINQSFRKYGALYRLDFENLEGSDLRVNPIFNIREDLLQLKKGIPFEKILQILSSAGKKNIILVIKAVPLFDVNKFKGGILVIEDLNIAERPEQEEVLKSEELAYTLNHLNNFLFVTDKNGIIRYSFGKNLDQLPLSPSALTGTELLLLFHEQARDIISEQLTAAKEKRLPGRINIELKSGRKTAVYECRTEPLVNESGQVKYIFFVFNEISGYVAHITSLESENKELNFYKSIIEEGKDGIITVSKEGDILYWSNTTGGIFGAHRDEVLNTFIGRVIGIDKEQFNNIKNNIPLTGNYQRLFNFINTRGERKVVEAEFRYSNSDTIFIIIRDITVKAAAEEELRKSEELFQNNSKYAGTLIINFTSDGDITYCNPAAAELTYYSEAELLNKKINNIFSPFPSFSEINSRGKEKYFVYNISAAGRRGNTAIRAYINPVYKPGNTSPDYYILTGTDITDLQNKEKDLQVFKSIFESSRDGIALEYERNIVMANKAFTTIFGFVSPDELVNRDILDLISSADILKAAEYFQSEQKVPEPGRLEILGRRKNGSTMSTEFTVSTFTMEDKVYRMIIARDITERKRAQQSIRESEEKYRNITDNIDDFLYTYESSGRTLVPTFYTSSVEKITGYTQAEFLKDSKLFLKIVHPDDFTIVKNKLKSLFKSRLKAAEEFEFRIINKHGNIVWVRNKINILRNYDKKIQKIYGLVSDISLRRRAEDELKISTSNLVKLNETKDKFISIISHDLRTPFTSILGFTDLLLNDEGLSEKDKKQYINFIRDSSKTMLSLVNSLLDWTRLQTGRFKFEPNRTEASLIIDACLNALSGAAYQKNIELIHSVRKDLFIFADSSLVTQVFNNLVSNAVKFTKPGGKIEISSAPSQEIRFHEFIVKDNGVGISGENINKLFKVETKFTSEGTAGEKGSGLGLSLVKEIIEKHGGTIWVNSTRGKGSEFHFTLPIAPATILLVDDSKTDKLLYSKILRNITPDYSIQIASNGKEALEIIETSPPALVVSDHLMPVMDGLQFIQALIKSPVEGKPPVIILSSELDRNIIQDYTELGIEYVFQKPVNLIHFKQAVEKSLRKGLIK